MHLAGGNAAGEEREMCDRIKFFSISLSRSRLLNGFVCLYNLLNRIFVGVVSRTLPKLIMFEGECWLGSNACVRGSDKRKRRLHPRKRIWRKWKCMCNSINLMQNNDAQRLPSCSGLRRDSRRNVCYSVLIQRRSGVDLRSQRGSPLISNKKFISTKNANKYSNLPRNPFRQ